MNADIFKELEARALAMSFLPMGTRQSAAQAYFLAIENPGAHVRIHFDTLKQLETAPMLLQLAEDFKVLKPGEEDEWSKRKPPGIFFTNGSFIEFSFKGVAPELVKKYDKK